MASSTELTRLRRHLGGRGTGSLLTAVAAWYWCAEDWELRREGGGAVPGPRESRQATQLRHGGSGSSGWANGDDTARGAEAAASALDGADSEQSTQTEALLGFFFFAWTVWVYFAGVAS